MPVRETPEDPTNTLEEWRRKLHEAEQRYVAKPSNENLDHWRKTLEAFADMVQRSRQSEDA